MGVKARLTVLEQKELHEEQQEEGESAGEILVDQQSIFTLNTLTLPPKELRKWSPRCRRRNVRSGETKRDSVRAGNSIGNWLSFQMKHEINGVIRKGAISGLRLR